MFKKQKGITLIALIITIIVLLILAGVTIAAITSNESAPNKAVKARTENDRGAARDAATLLVAEKTQEYYEGKYVGNNNTARTSATVLDYLKSVLSESAAVTTGGYTVVVDSNAKITVTKGETLMATGIVDAGGTVAWDAEPVEGGNNNPPVANTITIVSQDSNHSIPSVGDVVAYAPGSLTTANIELPEGAKIERTKLASIADDLPDGASLDSDIDASEATQWVVLKTVTDNSGDVTDVLIVPTTYDTDSLTLYGMNGYNNAITKGEQLGALDTVAQIYLNPTYAKSARSITVEDVNELEEHEPDGPVATAAFENEYGMNDDLDIVTGDKKNTVEIETMSNGEILKISSNLYQSNEETGYNNYALNSNILSDKYCWLASRCVSVDSYNCNFGVRYLNDGYVDGFYVFVVGCDGGYGGGVYGSCSVLPVVSLKAGIQMTWDSTNEKWTLE